MAKIDRSYEESEELLFWKYSDTTNPLDRNQCSQLMQFYLHELKIDINKLKYVHVTGSKGKGTTCAFVESSLRRHGLKTGLFTSPHLQTLCERFRINGKMISKETYMRHFNVVWDKLEEIERRPDRPDFASKWPGFFRFLTIVAFRLFIEEGVDVAILEVGMGGRLDSTNVIDYPITTGITLIDLEHTQILGDTLADIAYQKGGIFKKGCPAVVLRQSDESIESLRRCSKEADCSIQIVGQEVLPSMVIKDIPDHYPSYLLDNFSVAYQLVSNTLSSYNISIRDEIMHDVIMSTHVAARAQEVVTENNGQIIRYVIDGAHTPRSTSVIALWFESMMSLHSEEEKILLFYCGRDKNSLALINNLVSLPFSKVIFTMVKHVKPEYTKVNLPSIESLMDKEGIDDDSKKIVESIHCDDSFTGSDWLIYLAKVWRIEECTHRHQFRNVSFVPDADVAVEYIRENNRNKPTMVCCTGSLYLCGDLLNAVDWHEESDN